MQPDDTIPVSDLARRTRAVVERLAREPRRRLVVLKNSRPVAVISGIEAHSGVPGARGSLREELLRKKGMIAALARAHGVRSVRLFGSVARGEDGPESDVDLLVEFEPGRNLLDLIGLENDLADALGRKVDVITAGGARPGPLQRALRGAIRIM